MIKSLIFLLSFFVFSAQAMESVPVDERVSPHFIARIQLNTADELMGVLLRADQLFRSGDFIVGSDVPIAFVLHGPEAAVFFRQSYQQNSAIVDLAAKLTAFGVVDIKVCKTWMGGMGLNKSQLPPFVGTVRSGPAEEKRLLEEQNYVYF